jgi:bifunctional DNA-binding transcriptional regulator/antitoxin component of YhaV-PrlF toxin-antitoxin module
MSAWRNKMDTTTIQIEPFGGITLPSDLQDKYGIKTGDSFRVVDVDGAFVFIPITPTVAQLAQEIEVIRQEAGVSTVELLQGLWEQRSQNNASK